MKQNYIQKMLAAAAAMLLFFAATPARALPPIDFDIYIGGKVLNTDNFQNITAANGFTAIKSGTVTYDRMTRTLTFNKTRIEATNAISLYSSLPNLKIEVVGECYFNNSLNAYDMTLSTTTITGLGHLNAAGISMIHDESNTLTIDRGSTVTARSGLLGNGSSTLVINDATVTATNSARGAVTGFASLTMSAVSIATPGTAVWNSSQKSICYPNGSIVMGTVVIAPNYGIEIDGKHINTANYQNITASGGFTAIKSGTVSYNPTTKTLTFNNARIESTNTVSLRSRMADLNIVVTGECYFTNNSNAHDVFVTTSTISGSGHLNAYGISLMPDATRLTIKDCHVTARAGMLGNGTASLVVNNAHVSATNTYYGAVYNFTLLTMSGVSIATPVGAVWNSSQKAVCDAQGNIVKGTVVITQDYGLYIDGKPINMVNSHSINAANGFTAIKSGTVTYNSISKTLTLNNARIESTNTITLRSSISGLTINVVGECYCNNQANAYDFTLSSTTISGTGHLNVRGISMRLNDTNTLTIKDCRVTARSGLMGSSGINGGTGSTALVINNAHVSATNTFYGAVYNFTSLSLNGSSIASPAGAVWNSSQRAVCYANGNIVKGTVVFAQNYGIQIDGKHINSVNYQDITASGGFTAIKSGTVSYNPTTKTLTFNDARIESTSDISLRSSVSGLNIVGNGECYFSNQNNGYDFMLSTTTISGTGHLNMAGISMMRNETNTLTIRNCQVTARSGLFGSSMGGSSSLVINKAFVRATNSYYGSVYNFASLTTNQADITAPTGAVWNSSKKAVCDAQGEPIKTTVVFGQSYDFTIDGVEVTSANYQNISAANGFTAIKSGTVTFNPFSSLLTLNNTRIESTHSNSINSTLDGLKIAVNGDCYFKNDKNLYDLLLSSTTILGAGVLNVDGIHMQDDQGNTLTIRDCTVTARSGIMGSDHGHTSMFIQNATVNAENSQWGAITSIFSLMMRRCHIEWPVGASWNAEKEAVCDSDGNIIKSTSVVIRRDYGIQIGGTYITPTNYGDISSSGGFKAVKSGNVSFIPTTNTLTLDNAVIESTDNDAISISSAAGPIALVVVGDNSVTSSYVYGNALLNSAPVTIQGGGKVLFEYASTSPAVTAVLVSAWSSLTITDGCAVTVIGRDGYGIRGHNKKESLTVMGEGTMLSTTGKAGSLTGFQNFVLDDDLKILRPANAVWDEDEISVCDSEGNIVTTEVIIALEGTGIEAIDNSAIDNSQSTDDGAVYDLQGRKVGQRMNTDRHGKGNSTVQPFNLSTLKPGVYIVGGKKVVKP